MRKFMVVAILLLAVVLPQMAEAWNSTGHMVIAAMTYQGLQPRTRQTVDAILAKHPRCQEWKGQWKADIGAALSLYIFMRAATWPDEIRDEKYTWVKQAGVFVKKDGKVVIDPNKAAERKAYNHPNWHYVDYPLVPKSFAMRSRPTPNDDVIYGIKYSQKKVHTKTTSEPERAIYLSWLIHVTGDIHQPEHCATLFGNAFPYGDRGGNWFYVKTATRQPFELHGFWDALLGTSEAPKSVLDTAHKLAIDPTLVRSKFPELTKHKTVESWGLESRKDAVSTVYLRGTLTAAPAKFALDPKTKEPVLLSVDKPKANDLPKDYQSDATATARRRFALASYRLDDELARYLK